MRKSPGLGAHQKKNRLARGDSTMVDGTELAKRCLMGFDSRSGPC
jgi:hypothetical protein